MNKLLILLIVFCASTSWAMTIDSPTIIGGMVASGQYLSTQYTSTVNVNWNNGNAQTVTLSPGSNTLTFSNGQQGGRYLLLINQPVATTATVTFPTTVRWQQQATPAVTALANYKDIFTFYFDGQNFYGNSALDYNP